jgi:hypothetical protein
MFRRIAKFALSPPARTWCGGYFRRTGLVRADLDGCPPWDKAIDYARIIHWHDPCSTPLRNIA